MPEVILDSPAAAAASAVPHTPAAGPCGILRSGKRTAPRGSALSFGTAQTIQFRSSVAERVSYNQVDHAHKSVNKAARKEERQGNMADDDSEEEEEQDEEPNDSGGLSDGDPWNTLHEHERAEIKSADGVSEEQEQPKEYGLECNSDVLIPSGYSYFSIRNSGLRTVDLRGWFVCSQQSVMEFEIGSVAGTCRLQSGESIMVLPPLASATVPPRSDHFIHGLPRRIFADSGDIALLFNKQGLLCSETKIPPRASILADGSPSLNPAAASLCLSGTSVQDDRAKGESLRSTLEAHAKKYVAEVTIGPVLTQQLLMFHKNGVEKQWEVLKHAYLLWTITTKLEASFFTQDPNRGLPQAHSAASLCVRSWLMSEFELEGKAAIAQQTTMKRCNRAFSSLHIDWPEAFRTQSFPPPSLAVLGVFQSVAEANLPALSRFDWPVQFNTSCLTKPATISFLLSHNLLLEPTTDQQQLTEAVATLIARAATRRSVAHQTRGQAQPQERYAQLLRAALPVALSSYTLPAAVKELVGSSFSVVPLRSLPKSKERQHFIPWLYAALAFAHGFTPDEVRRRIDPPVSEDESTESIIEKFYDQWENTTVQRASESGEQVRVDANGPALNWFFISLSSDEAAGDLLEAPEPNRVYVLVQDEASMGYLLIHPQTQDMFVHDAKKNPEAAAAAAADVGQAPMELDAGQQPVAAATAEEEKEEMEAAAAAPQVDEMSMPDLVPLKLPAAAAAAPAPAAKRRRAKAPAPAAAAAAPVPAATSKRAKAPAPDAAPAVLRSDDDEEREEEKSSQPMTKRSTAPKLTNKRTRHLISTSHVPKDLGAEEEEEEEEVVEEEEDPPSNKRRKDPSRKRTRALSPAAAAAALSPAAAAAAPSPAAAAAAPVPAAAAAAPVPAATSKRAKAPAPDAAPAVLRSDDDEEREEEKSSQPMTKRSTAPKLTNKRTRHLISTSHVPKDLGAEEEEEEEEVVEEEEDPPSNKRRKDPSRKRTRALSPAAAAAALSPAAAAAAPSPAAAAAAPVPAAAAAAPVPVATSRRAKAPAPAADPVLRPRRLHPSAAAPGTCIQRWLDRPMADNRTPFDDDITAVMERGRCVVLLHSPKQLSEMLNNTKLKFLAPECIASRQVQRWSPIGFPVEDRSQEEGEDVEEPFSLETDEKLRGYGANDPADMVQSVLAAIDKDFEIRKATANNPLDQAKQDAVRTSSATLASNFPAFKPNAKYYPNVTPASLTPKCRAEHDADVETAQTSIMHCKALLESDVLAKMQKQEKEKGAVTDAGMAFLRGLLEQTMRKAEQVENSAESMCTASASEPSLPFDHHAFLKHEKSIGALVEWQFEALKTPLAYCKTECCGWFHLHGEDHGYMFVHSQPTGASGWVVLSAKSKSRVPAMAEEFLHVVNTSEGKPSLREVAGLPAADREAIATLLVLNKGLRPPLSLLAKHGIEFEILILTAGQTIIGPGDCLHMGFNVSGCSTAIATNVASSSWATGYGLKDAQDFFDNVAVLAEVEKACIDSKIEFNSQPLNFNQLLHVAKMDEDLLCRSLNHGGHSTACDLWQRIREDLVMVEWNDASKKRFSDLPNKERLQLIKTTIPALLDRMHEPAIQKFCSNHYSPNDAPGACESGSDDCWQQRRDDCATAFTALADRDLDLLRKLSGFHSSNACWLVHIRAPSRKDDQDASVWWPTILHRAAALDVSAEFMDELLNVVGEDAMSIGLRTAARVQPESAAASGLDATNNVFWTPLQVAIHEQHLGCAKAILQRNPASLMNKLDDDNGHTGGRSPAQMIDDLPSNNKKAQFIACKEEAQQQQPQ